MNDQHYRRTMGHVFEIRHGGGALSLGGIPFLAAGCLALFGSLGIISVDHSNGTGRSKDLIIFLMSLPFLGMGGGLLLGRTRTVVDRNAGRITKEWRLLSWTVYRKEYDLRDYNTVTVRFSPGSADSADTYPVSLRPKAGSKELTIEASTRALSARELAGDLARFLGMPLEDLSGNKS